MEVAFRDGNLIDSETDASFDGGYAPAIVKAFRKRMQAIRAAEDERAFYALKSVHFEKLKGNRDHQFSMRLNDQWRLILAFDGVGKEKVVRVLAIEDYH